MNTVLKEHRFPSGQRLQIVQGDLTQEEVDAIVNAANAQLKRRGRGGGDFTRRAADQSESDEWCAGTAGDPCRTGLHEREACPAGPSSTLWARCGARVMKTASLPRRSPAPAPL